MFRKNVITVNNIHESKATLTLYENSKKKLETKAFIGRNGITKQKQEGDGKTPIGKCQLGICFGTHDKKEILLENYVQINENLYWVDDVKSKYYNQLVDITKVSKDWKSAEHLIEFPRQYEYAIEIKTNPHNIPGKGSAIFLHCSIGKPTAGCIAIDREEMQQIFNKMRNDKMLIVIKK